MDGMRTITDHANELGCCAKPEGLAKCPQKVVGGEPQRGVGAGQVRQCQVQQGPRDILRSYQPLICLEKPVVLAILGLGASDGLQNIGFFGAGEVHDDPAIVRPEPKSGVVFGLNRRWGLVNLAQSEYVVDGAVQPVFWEDVLLLCRCYLDELAANFDDHLDLPLGLGESSHRLENKTCVGDDADGFLGKMELT
jgi:hypothetical protein